MRDKVIKVLKWLAYPAAYLFCLALFGYLTFPFGRLKDRVSAEAEQRGKPGQRLEIGTLTSYWFTGIAMQDVKLVLPPSNDAVPASPFGPTPSESSASKETTITIDEAHVRARLFPLLIGRVRLDFGATLFGGEVSGTVPAGAAADVSVNWDKLDVGKVEPLSQLIGGLPLKGSASGQLELQPVESKFSKANGSLDLTVASIVIGDGKTKVMGAVELPPAKAGDLTITGEAKDGVLKITKLSNTGPDVEVVGDGRITLREPWDASTVDIYIRFRFSDAYRSKSDATKSLLGDPGSPLPPLIEVQDPRMKRSKRTDGFYGWHIHGPLKKLAYDPASSDAAAGRKPGSKTDTPFTPPAMKKPPPFQLPVGTSTAKDGATTPPSPPTVNLFRPAPTPPSEPPPTADPAPPPPPPQPGVLTPAGNFPPQMRPGIDPLPIPPPQQPPPPPPDQQQPQPDNGGGE